MRSGREITVGDEQVELLIEGLIMLRLYENGNPDDTVRVTKTAECERLENRLRRKLAHRGQGNVGNYAEKL